MYTVTGSTRRHKRIDMKCAVSFSSGGGTYDGTTENVSIDGMLIKTANVFPPGTMLSLEVRLPEGAASRVNGVVRRLSNHSATGSLGSTFAGAGQDKMGIEITGRDTQYIQFVLALLTGRKFEA